MPGAFYREEWQRVIQPQSIETLEQYKRASRIGRGTRLSRADRVLVWPVFEEYRNLLALHRKKEVDDAYRDAAALLANESRQLPYLAVIVDEAQDMSTQAFRLIRQLVARGTNDLFIKGLVPLDQAIHDKADEVAFRQAELEERALLYVAMTRAKRGCLICSYGEQSPFLE